MNGCCSDWTPENGCLHWGPDKPSEDPLDFARMKEREMEENERSQW